MLRPPDFNPILALQLILDLYGQIVMLQQQLQQAQAEIQRRGQHHPGRVPNVPDDEPTAEGQKDEEGQGHMRHGRGGGRTDRPV